MNTLIKTVLSMCVVVVILGGALVPLIDAINKEETTITETITYGDNPMESYTDIIASAQRGDVSSKYTVQRGDFDISTSQFTPDDTGDYIKAYALAAKDLTFYAPKVNAGLYVGSDAGSAMAAELATYTYPYSLTYAGQTWNLALNSSNDKIVEISVTDATDGAYAVMPYDVLYDVPTETIYQNNTVQTSTVSSQYGTMSGTTFTPDASGDWLSIPLYVLNNGSNTYKVADGATYYAPDTNGDLAAFTAPNTTGVNSAITITFTQDTSITSATVYTMVASSSDSDLQHIILKKEIKGSGIAQFTNVKSVVSTPSNFYNKSVFVLLNTGELYASGANNYGQLGVGDTNDRISFEHVADNISYVYTTYNVGSGGASSTYAITSDCDLYVTGFNNNGQLGVGDTNDRSSFVKALSDVEKIVANGKTALALTSTGAVFATGYNAGAYGNGSTALSSSWVEIISSDATDIALSIDTNNNPTSYYIDDSNVLYATGNNAVGQFGIQTAASSTTTWQRVAENVSKIDAQYRAATYIDLSGKLYTTGYNNNGQQGTGDTTLVELWSYTGVSDAVEVLSTYNIPASWMGRYVLTSSGDVFSAGESLNYGDGLTQHKTYTKIASNVSSFVYLSNAAMMIDKTGVVYGIGNNTGYILGQSDVSTNYSTWTSLGLTDVVFVNGFGGNSAASWYVSGPNASLYGSGYAEGSDGSHSTGVTQYPGWTPISANMSVTIHTNATEAITITDSRGSISGTTFTPSASGDMLQIPLRNLAQYTYYIGDGATYYAPDANNDLAAFTAPNTTGINPSISLTFTDMGSSYYGTLNSLTATVTDSDLKALIIPYTAKYTVPVPTHYAYNFVGASQDFVFSANPTGDYIKIPGLVLAENTYHLDDASTYYALDGSQKLVGFTTPSTTGVTGVTLSFEADNALTDVYKLNGSGDGYVIIPRVYDTDRVNGVDVVEHTFTPVRGKIVSGGFVEDATGSLVKVYAANLNHATYRLGQEVTYYVADNGTVEATKTVPDTAGIPGASLTLTEDSSNVGFYIMTGTTDDADTTVIMPYTASYTVTETITKERLPILSTIPLIVILVGVVATAAILIAYRRMY